MARRSRDYSEVEKALITGLAITIKQERQARGLSQEALAELAQLNRSHISKLEQTSTDPQFITVCRVARVLGISIDDLMAQVHQV